MVWTFQETAEISLQLFLFLDSPPPDLHRTSCQASRRFLWIGPVGIDSIVAVELWFSKTETLEDLQRVMEGF